MAEIYRAKLKKSTKFEIKPEANYSTGAKIMFSTGLHKFVWR